MVKRTLAAAFLLAALAAPARAELDELLYPPELVQRFGRQAGVTDEQLDKLRKDVLAVRTQMIDVEAKLKRLHLEIESALLDDATPIDDILAKVAAVGAAETEMKKLQMGLMIRIRRSLTADQRKKLDELRSRMPPPQPPMPPQSPMPPQPPQPGQPPQPMQPPGPR